MEHCITQFEHVPGFEGSGRRWYRWIELVESYLEHCLTQLEHVPGRILGGITLEKMRKKQYLGIFGWMGWEIRVADGTIG